MIQSQIKEVFIAILQATGFILSNKYLQQLLMFYIKVSNLDKLLIHPAKKVIVLL